ncbi:hypothetical protein SELMODRAFT_427199 [Selaginella moellendorffii]|uniref:Uncharacterized protein n=1 Tax=Selaginella moellendorffii TaxID=88036 RepID=D8SYU5_SELML|nr:hypothetical protein SELMODRAFT_427199 [Selaginella moellendorffii]
MAKRARKIFESASFRPPTEKDLTFECLASWVRSNFASGEIDAVAGWLHSTGSKRTRLANLNTREEFLAAVDSMAEESLNINVRMWRARRGAAPGMGIAQKAFFDYPLQDMDILEELWRKIEQDYMTWITPGSRYLAPYFAVVQGSGWGKSRLACELHRKGLYTIYVSCMKVDSAGMPGRTPHLADWICTTNATALKMTAFLIASIEALGEYVGEGIPESDTGNSKEEGGGGPNPGLWILKQTHPEHGFPIAAMIRDKIPGCLERLQDSAVVAQEAPGLITFERQTTNFLWGENHVYRTVQRALKAAIEKLPVLGVAGPDGKRLKVLFCFDEARTLADTELADEMDTGFTLLRRVLRTASSGLWAVMLGTNPRLSNSVPAQALDPTRKVPSRDFKLFKPFWLTGTAAPPRPGGAESVFRLGRPLWRAFIDRGCSPEKLLGLARDKLNLQEELKDEMVVGVLGCTVGVEVASWSEVAELSMAHHMMTASWISEDMQRVHVSNAAEPVLASAAASVLLDKNKLCKILVSVSKMCKKGVVTGDPRGEMVTRLLVLLAMLTCLKGKKDVMYTKKITLREFLTTLLGMVPDGLASTVHLDAELQFNSFSPTYGRLDAALINDCSQHYRALTCKPGQKAVHNVLPSSKGAIGIQAKRWEADRKTGMAKAVEKLEAGVDGVGFMLSLVFQLGSPDNRVSVEGSAQQTIVIYGLSRQLFPFLLEDSVVDAMRDVLKLNTRGHVLQMTDTEEDIESYKILVYKTQGERSVMHHPLVTMNASIDQTARVEAAKKCEEEKVGKKKFFQVGVESAPDILEFCLGERGPPFRLDGNVKQEDRQEQQILESSGSSIAGLQFSNLMSRSLRDMIELAHWRGIYVTSGGWAEDVLGGGRKSFKQYVQDCKDLDFDMIEFDVLCDKIAKDDFLYLKNEAWTLPLRRSIIETAENFIGAGADVIRLESDLDILTTEVS